MAPIHRAEPIPAGLRRSIVALAFAGATCALAPDAGAQTTDRVAPTNGDGMDQHLFRPASDSKGFFSVNGALAMVMAAGQWIVLSSVTTPLLSAASATIGL